MAGDVAIARRAANSSVALGRHGRWVEALTQATVAVADALEGRRDQGVAAGRAAIAALLELGVRFDAAEIAFGMARALPRTIPNARGSRTSRGMCSATPPPCSCRTSTTLP